MARVENAQRALRSRRAAQALRNTSEALDRSDLWRAWIEFLRAGSLGAAGPEVETLRSSIERAGSEAYIVEGKRHGTEELESKKFVIDRGWPVRPRLEAGWVRVEGRWCRTADLEAEGWLRVGEAWYPSVEAARRAGCFLFEGVLVSAESLRAAGVFRDPNGDYRRIEELRSAGLCCDRGVWRTREELVATGRAVAGSKGGVFVSLHALTARERVLADRRLGMKRRLYSPDEMAARGLLQLEAVWYPWQDLVASGQAVRGEGVGGTVRGFRFEVDPVLGLCVRWSE